MKKKEKESKYEYKNRRKFKIKQLLLILILVICSVSLISTFGRYVTDNKNSFFLKSKEFYFNSDKLTNDNAKYQIDNWSGVDDYVITINMNSNKNNLTASSYDIGYEISYQCSPNMICQLSKTSGTILGSTNADYFNVIITPNAVLKTGDSVWVYITATSTTPYKKTLKSTFTLIVGKENLSYEIVDKEKSPYLSLKATNTLSYYNIKEAFDTYTIGQRIDRATYLTLTPEKKNKCYSAEITLVFDPRKVLIDMTNPEYLKSTNIIKTTIDGYEYISGLTFRIDAISSANVRFYKTNVEENYTYPIKTNTSIITVTSI